MDLINNGWFSEINDQWPGQALSLQVEDVLFHGKSDYQDVLVFKSRTFGTVLVLDGVIQITDQDEFAYQEMIAHLPLFSHTDPKDVLIVGGGDGAVVSQVAKHKTVKSITLCEIDQVVIDTAKKYFPKYAKGWSDPRLTVNVGDGLKYLESFTQPKFDVIIVDSSDPVGPAEGLFSSKFYNLMRKVLRPGGVVCAQTECIWLHLDLIAKLKKYMQEHYEHVDYAYTTIPTYPSGQIGFLVASLANSPKTPSRRPTEENFEGCEDLKYYSPEIHCASFVLPVFAQKALN